MRTPPLIPAWLLLATLAAFALALCVSLSGCASVPSDWHRAHPPSVKPWLYVTVTDTDFACRSAGSDPAHRLEVIHGCATWKPIGCVIYLPANPPAWLLTHEQHHCEGFAHD